MEKSKVTIGVCARCHRGSVPLGEEVCQPCRDWEAVLEDRVDDVKQFAALSGGGLGHALDVVAEALEHLGKRR
jgi:hypothetical protein